MTIARSGPAETSATKSTAYAIDIVEFPRPSGSRSLNAERINAAPSSVSASHGRGYCSGANWISSAAPVAMTPPT